MIHMTKQMIDWIVNNKSDQNGAPGVSTIGREGLIGACGKRLAHWQPSSYNAQKDRHIHYATAVAYTEMWAQKHGVGLNQLMMHYKKVDCPKCIQILKNNGL